MSISDNTNFAAITSSSCSFFAVYLFIIATHLFLVNFTLQYVQEACIGRGRMFPSECMHSMPFVYYWNTLVSGRLHSAIFAVGL